MAQQTAPMLDLFEAKEWNVTEVDTLGTRSANEAKKLGAKLVTLSLLTTGLVCAFMPRPLDGSVCLLVAKVVLIFALFMEFVRGYLHFFWPYSSHLTVSGMADNVNIRHNEAALGLVAQVTHQFGAANLLLGCMYAPPLLFPDPHNASLVYALAVTLVVRIVQAYQRSCKATTFFQAALPKWLAGGDLATRQKAPPGKSLQDLQILVQLIGMAAAVAALYGY
eukprot:TRINITY_DN26532_c0_g3_i1.p1 TRINITY_DN26532_c0_g3~~TRINITY_DN26532_c0_g3_i1.p1  ORF type:complete len:222 (-),score=39.87 TRINITY_DN26532_c0_g3_i1:296-961(-)